MDRSTVYSLVAITGFAFGTAIQWLRENSGGTTKFEQMLLGSAPNFFAAIAIAFLCLAVFTAAKYKTDKWMLSPLSISLSISGIGLFAWEFWQLRSGGLVFDPLDLVATLTALVLTALALSAVQRIKHL